MKRPASQYYWGDWRRDTALQACSLAARGLWHEMNCLMHDCEPYGHLRVGQAPMGVAQLARLVGETARVCAGLLSELEAAGVFSRAGDGSIYSRRMVRDEALRERRANGGHLGAEAGWAGAEHGKKGGRPRKKNPPPDVTEGGFLTPVDASEKPPPASASASATAVTLNTITAKRAPHCEPQAQVRAPDPDPGPQPEEPPEIRPAVAVCIALRKAGMPDANAGHPTLLALLDAGATVPQFVGLVPQALGKGNAFAWLLATLKGQMSDAKAAPIRRAPALNFDSKNYRDGITEDGRIA